MGSKSKSSSSTATNVADNGSVIASGTNNTINYMSDEALAHALDFASGEGEGTRELVGKALELFVTQQDKGITAVTDTAFKAIDSQRSEGAETLKYLIYAGVAIAAIVSLPAIMKGFK